MTNQGMVVFADTVLTPAFPATVFRTYEAVVELLENTPVRELWLGDDLKAAVGTDSLVDYLTVEAGWEGQSNIGTIVLFAASPDDVADLMAVLKPGYNVRYQALTPELFTSVSA